MIEEQHHTTCSQGHITEARLLQRFNLGLGPAGRTSLDSPVNGTNITPLVTTENRNSSNLPCPFCGSTNLATTSASYLRTPEILILACPTRPLSPPTTFPEFAYRISLSEDLRILPSDSESYTLVGATLITGDSYNIPPPGFIVAAVRAPSGNITLVDDDVVVARGPRWSNIEALQVRNKRTEMLLPHMLIYRRTANVVEPSAACFLPGSISDQTEVEKAVLAMKLALPHVAPQDILGQYTRVGGSIQKTIDFFLSGVDTKKAASLDEVPPLYLEGVLQAYVQFPQLKIQLIFEAVATYHGNFDLAIKALGDVAGRRVNCASEEWVGGVGVEVDVDVVGEQFVDGYARLRDGKTRKVKMARVFGVLVEGDGEEVQQEWVGERRRSSGWRRTGTRVRSGVRAGSSGRMSDW
jgi:hypothetical protein